MTGLKDAHALLVGIAHYTAINPLPETVLNDARAVREVLIDPLRGGYAPDRVNSLLDNVATQAALRSALQDLAEKTTADSTVLIYLSSHGGRIESGPYQGEYILPVDVDYTSDKRVAQTAISSDELTRALRAIAAHKLLVIFDCCHSGGIGQPKDVTGPIMKGGLSEATYDALKAGRGRVIIASSRSDEASWVLPHAQNSLFTQHLLAGLNGGATNTDGLIRIFDLYDYVQPKVTADQPNQHTVFKGELEDNFPVALYPTGKAPQTIVPQATMSASTTGKGDFTYDVFIAYADVDKKWVKAELLPRLENAGLTVCVDYRDFRIGAPKVRERERAVLESRKTLLVLSPAYLNSDWANLSESMAQTLDPASRDLRFLPLLKDECEVPLHLHHLESVSLLEADELNLAWTKLLAALGATVSSTSAPAHSKATAAPATASPQYDTAVLREWINASLGNTELDNLCYDHFRPVYDDFASGMMRTQKIQRLIEYCVQRNCVPELIRRVNDINPVQYPRFQGKLFGL